jgi:DNA polymerase-1
MEIDGVKLDVKYLAELAESTHKKINKLEKKIHELAGMDFNIKSTQQLAEVLFEKLELSTAGIGKTKTGISTGADELEKLKDQHPIIKLIMEYREFTKLASTYIDSLPKQVNKKTGRLHTSFNQTIAATGRLSSIEPNLQNIPVRTEFGREIRSAFVADRGYKLVSLDYSQIELRLAAHFSGDKKMIETFKKGEDIHRATAAAINEVKLEDVTSEMRREAKATNFGILYGQGPHGLSATADIPYMKAKEFIDHYFEVYKGVKKYIEETIEEAKKKGFVETLYGRRRYLPEINSSVMQIRKAAERMAVNTPLQGTAADLIKVAMIEIAKVIKDKYNKDEVKMILQVHDELLFEIKDGLAEKAAKEFKDIMEQGIKLKVPVEVDIKIGRNWGEME